jgi:hypothetical protein
VGGEGGDSASEEQLRKSCAYGICTPERTIALENPVGMKKKNKAPGRLRWCNYREERARYSYSGLLCGVYRMYETAINASMKTSTLLKNKFALHSTEPCIIYSHE